MADSADTNMQSSVTYEQLAEIETEFEEIDNDIIARQYIISKDAYARRRALVLQIPQFWPEVFEESPDEIQQCINPSDQEIIADGFKELEVDRFEIPADTTLDSRDKGEPRSLLFRFHFKPNEHFENEVLEKKFWYRRHYDGWSGLVSEPVKINWKKGKDITDGLTDAAYGLWEAQNKAAPFREVQLEELPEYTTLKEKLEEMEGLTSFFAWFGYRGRHITAKESVLAQDLLAKQKERIKSKGEPTKEEEMDESAVAENVMNEAIVAEDVEVFPEGEDVAIALAEDLWPSAIKYFTTAQERSNMSASDISSEGAEMDGTDEDEQDVDVEIMDIRGLVKGKGANGDGPPNKKRKT